MVTSGPADPALFARNLECIRGDRLLFTKLSFGIDSGEMLSIEGANGAGKTSLLRILAGLSAPDDGEVLWQGDRIQAIRSDYCAATIYLGHHSALKAELSPLENLRVWLALSGTPVPDAHIRKALCDIGLSELRDAPTRTLSAGQRQRSCLTRLMLRSAKLWILDEPFTALDRTGLELVRRLLDRHSADGGMVIMTSHQPISVSGKLRTLSLS